jgi:hypothetical protein
VSNFRSMRGAITASTLAVLVVLTGCTATGHRSSDADLQQQLGSARTQTDHEALAEIYEARARAACRTAQEHQWQALTAQLHQLGTVDSVSGRCMVIARSLLADAAEYDKIAADHRARALAASAQEASR